MYHMKCLACTYNLTSIMFDLCLDFGECIMTRGKNSQCFAGTGSQCHDKGKELTRLRWDWFTLKWQGERTHKVAFGLVHTKMTRGKNSPGYALTCWHWGGISSSWKTWSPAEWPTWRPETHNTWMQLSISTNFSTHWGYQHVTVAVNIHQQAKHSEDNKTWL